MYKMIQLDFKSRIKKRLDKKSDL